VGLANNHIRGVRDNHSVQPMTEKTRVRRISLNVDFSAGQRPVLSEVREYFRRNGREFRVNQQDFDLLIRALDVCPSTIRLPKSNLGYFLEVYGRLYGAKQPADIPEESMIAMLQYLIQRGLSGFNIEAHKAEERVYKETVGKAIIQETVMVKTTEIRVIQEDLSKRYNLLHKYEREIAAIEPKPPKTKA
jgi:hypothetical protein